MPQAHAGVELGAPLSRGGQWFGAALALDERRLLVGAPRSNRPGGAWLEGLAIFYERDPTTGAWVQIDELFKPVTSDLRLPFFGSAVALGGDVAVVVARTAGRSSTRAP